MPYGIGAIYATAPPLCQYPFQTRLAGDAIASRIVRENARPLSRRRYLLCFVSLRRCLSAM